MQTFDVIVIGSGPAGSAAAAWLARNGYSVALIDKVKFPRDKLCGGLFTERSRKYHREIFGADFQIAKAVTKHDVTLWHAGQPLGTLTDIPPLHLTMRRGLDADLQALALSAGATDFSGQAIANITATSVQLKSGQALAAKVLIGADGVNSLVARTLFGQAFDHNEIGFALEIEAPLPPLPLEKQPLRIDFDAAKWGYGWSFPKQHSVTIGIGGLHRLNPGMKAQLTRYLNDLNVAEGAKVKGHFLPFGHFRKTPGKGAVLLAGDAAGLVDPITGEGIAFALKSGQLAAQAAIEALTDNAPETALRRYKRALRPLHRNLRIARGLRSLIFANRIAPIFYKKLKSSGHLRQDYMALLGGELEYPQILRKIITRLPRIFLRNRSAKVPASPN
ncbi:geranylgeranyl reductase family protein [Cognatishimia sp. WU-CL00825]|uniref:NAD(P)/FAD-dependent oxidoreductase n=1 Tax=Cognatishimia sp. WU-CL00825 TaxID=3127658 RepID=UPI00310BA9BE